VLSFSTAIQHQSDYKAELQEIHKRKREKKQREIRALMARGQAPSTGEKDGKAEGKGAGAGVGEASTPSA
jgi:hypothetical protein